ncbi:MAG: hypothetical protein ACFB0D_04460 [Phormidesmis sp.]
MRKKSMGAESAVSADRSSTFPLPLTAAVAGICILPFLLNLIGVDSNMC